MWKITALPNFYPLPSVGVTTDRVTMLPFHHEMWIWTDRLLVYDNINLNMPLKK